MIEKDIIDAGFERIDIPAESADDKAFYYYTYGFTSAFGLITPASDEVEDEWFVEVFEVPEIQRRRLVSALAHHPFEPSTFSLNHACLEPSIFAGWHRGKRLSNRSNASMHTLLHLVGHADWIR